MTPVKALERLILYRTILEQNSARGVTNIFSRELANQTGNNPAQVRRDLMYVGYTGNPQKGYMIGDLLVQINKLLEPKEGITLALIGIGNLGRAIMGYFGGFSRKFRLIAAFDSDEHKVNRVISGCRCHHIRDIGTVLQPHRIQLGVITVPSSAAQDAADLLIEAGVLGIVNFAPLPVKAPASIYIENMDITKTFEKVAYFARLQNRGNRHG
jgi:redox-sensing transcriptional repressor